MRPAIIFFDEIDGKQLVDVAPFMLCLPHGHQVLICILLFTSGLAPVRSSRQDQIHSSIVSTLLALMDGLDARGQVRPN